MVIPREKIKIVCEAQKKKSNSLSEIDKAYIAGFFDGDGSIIVQIVKDETRKYKFMVRVSLGFYQKTTNHWFILWLKEKFAPHGYITKRKNSGVSEFVIVAIAPVESVLKELYPYLKLKKALCSLVLKIISDLKKVQTEADFLKVCELVDEIAEYNYSKIRKINSQYVKNYLNLPVETSNESSTSICASPPARPSFARSGWGRKQG